MVHCVYSRTLTVNFGTRIYSGPKNYAIALLSNDDDKYLKYKVNSLGILCHTVGDFYTIFIPR